MEKRETFLNLRQEKELDFVRRFLGVTCPFFSKEQHANEDVRFVRSNNLKWEPQVSDVLNHVETHNFGGEIDLKTDGEKTAVPRWLVVGSSGY